MSRCRNGRVKHDAGLYPRRREQRKSPVRRADGPAPREVASSCIRFTNRYALRRSGPPAMSPDTAVTRLLIDWKRGDKEAPDVLAPLVYSELRRLAGHYLRDERAAATLQPTALVHEAYLRLVAQTLPDWESRSHFFGVAAHRMRQILVEHRGAARPSSAVAAQQRSPWRMRSVSPRVAAATWKRWMTH